MKVILSRVSHKGLTYVPVNEIQLSQISLTLAQKVLDSDWKPTWVVALWRGGVTLGILVQEMLKRHGVMTDHISIRTSSYQSGVNGAQNSSVEIHAANYITNNMKSTDRILVVDDLQESGKTYIAIKEYFDQQAQVRGIGCPELRLAVGLRKLGKSTFDPDYHVVDVKGSDWIVLPHEVSDFVGVDRELMYSLFPYTCLILNALETKEEVDIEVRPGSLEV